MEDSSRDLEKELKKYAVANPFKRTGQWQMLLISNDGKMISVKRYKDLAVILIAVLVISLLSTAVLSVLYIRAFSANRTLKEDIAVTEQERKDLQEEKERLVAQLFISKKKNQTEVAEAKTEAPKAPNPPPVKKVVKKVEKIKATIRDLTVTKDEAANETRIRFIVKNDCELKSIAGRVFVILKPDTLKAQEWLTMPPVILKDGMPSMPSRGQFFSINNYKSVNFKFTNPLPDDHYKTMAIFIYSTEGELIYEDTFDIDLIVINKPSSESEASAIDNNAASPVSTEKPAMEQPAMAVANPGALENDADSPAVSSPGVTDSDEGGGADEE